jgi:hypothetical protein
MKQFLNDARWIGLMLFALLSGACDSECAAGPLVLRGTATVATAANGLNPDLMSFSPLPLDVSVGDIFEFELSIDTIILPGAPGGYPTTFSARIGGVDVVDAGLLTLIFNDSFIYAEYIAEFIFADDTGGLGDRIRTYIPGSSGHLLSAQAPAFQTSFLFTSSVSSSLLTNTQVPDDTATWQSFAQRELALAFDNRSYLGAYITSIAIVPEPTTFSLFAFSVIALLGRNSLKREPQRHL